MNAFSLWHLAVISFLSKRGVRDEIATFDARSITPDIRDAVSELLKRSAKSFEEKVSRYLYKCWQLLLATSYTPYSSEVVI